MHTSERCQGNEGGHIDPEPAIRDRQIGGGLSMAKPPAPGRGGLSGSQSATDEMGDRAPGASLPPGVAPAGHARSLTSHTGRAAARRNAK
eukprot:1517303-Pyramimonas_sp.AAC.1